MSRWLAAGMLSIAGLMLAAGAASQAAPKPQAVQIVAGSPQNEFTFTPAQITVLAGQPVRLTVVNKGKVEHDFHIEALRVKSHTLILPGKSVTLEFIPAKKGTLEFMCSVPGHKEAGMMGTIVVK